MRIGFLINPIAGMGGRVGLKGTDSKDRCVQSSPSRSTGCACMNSFARGNRPGDKVRAADVGKRLMDFGFHPPTVNFPLIVAEAMMIEPTETEDKATPDAFAAAMRQIADEAGSEPELLRGAPHAMPVRRLDEVRAAREAIVSEQIPDA